MLRYFEGLLFVNYLLSGTAALKRHSSVVDRKQQADFAAFVGSLMKLRRSILKQIETIDDVLELKSPVRCTSRMLRPRLRRRTAQVPLRSVVAEVIKQKPMDRHEILQAVQVSGYQFSTDDPLNSLSAALYSNKKIFRQENKKFYLVSGYETEIVPKKRGRKPKKVSSPAA